MKITVEMTVEDFADFVRFREGKKAEETEVQAVRRQLRRLGNEIWRVLGVNRKREIVEITFEAAERLLDMASEARL